MTPEFLTYQRRPPMVREYRWYANIADIEFRQQLDVTALLERTIIWMEKNENGVGKESLEKLLGRKS